MFGIYVVITVIIIADVSIEVGADLAAKSRCCKTQPSPLESVGSPRL